MRKSLKIVAATVLSTLAINITTASAQTWVARSSQEISNSLSTGDGVYVIQWGDTLSSIAEATGHSVESLAVINEISDVHLIQAGAVLYFDDANNTVSYVEPGQTSASTYELDETASVAEASQPAYLVSETAEWVNQPASPAEEVTEAEVTESTSVEETSEVAVEAPVETSQAPVVEESSQVVETTSEAPVTEEVVTQAPAVEEVTQAPVVEETQAPSETNTSAGTNQYGGIVSEAKEWIAMKESGGSYTISNPSGKYYGRYQLTIDYLNGDLSPENQERVADEYVLNRYGSWEAAKAFWLENNWY